MGRARSLDFARVGAGTSTVQVSSAAPVSKLLMSPPDHYSTLGVARDASTDDIKKAFRKLARECHPDVAGDDPAAAARFTKVRAAYEVLVDPEQRDKYDRRRARRSRRRRGDGFRMPGGFWSNQGFSSKQEPPRPGAARRRANSAANNLDLEDLFGEFGGGDVRTTPGGYSYRGGRPASSGPLNRGDAPRRPGDDDFGFGNRPPPPDAGDSKGSRARRPGGGGEPGRDISMQVDVPAETALRGGTVTLQYPRLRLGDDGRSVFRYDEICDLRVPPGTRHGDTLRVTHYGDAGTGGTTGDLVCDVRVVGEVRPETPPEPPNPGAARTASVGPDDDPAVRRVPVSVSEALLGGRLELETPGGRVRVTLPPCLRPGARLRLKGRGPDGADLFVEPTIVLPERLDDESRALIEQFAVLNPDDPRG